MQLSHSLKSPFIWFILSGNTIKKTAGMNTNQNRIGQALLLLTRGLQGLSRFWS